MADSILSLMDLAKFNGLDGMEPMIDEVTKTAPELRIVPGRTIKGLNYKTLVRTGLPTVGFRDFNEGTDRTKATYENRLVEAFLMNPRWGADKAAADVYEDGAAAYIAMEAEAHLQASVQHLSSQFYYGSANDAKGFVGLLDSYDSANMTVDATGDGSDCTSVWLVKFGPGHVQFVYGNNGEMSLSDVDLRDMEDADGKRFTGYHQEMNLRIGLQVGSLRSVARIKDIDSGKPLTDALIYKALEKFAGGIVPDAIFLTKEANGMLRASRTATNATGAAAPIPEAIPVPGGLVPLIITEGITNTETAT